MQIPETGVHPSLSLEYIYSNLLHTCMYVVPMCMHVHMCVCVLKELSLNDFLFTAH